MFFFKLVQDERNIFFLSVTAVIMKVNIKHNLLYNTLANCQSAHMKCLNICRSMYLDKYLLEMSIKLYIDMIYRFSLYMKNTQDCI